MEGIDDKEKVKLQDKTMILLSQTHDDEIKRSQSQYTHKLLLLKGVRAKGTIKGMSLQSAYPPEKATKPLCMENTLKGVSLYNGVVFSLHAQYDGKIRKN